jgi:hypothetical protein
MKRAVLALGLSLLAGSAGADEVLKEISWGRLKAEGGLRSGTVHAADASTPFEYLELSPSELQGGVLPLLVLESPPITRSRYALVGQVSYEGVEGQGFLEMWSAFPNGGRYFSRTLAGSGPMQGVHGSSPWREVVLPFFNEEGAPPPTTLTVNLVLPGRGTVRLGPLRLVQYPSGADPLAARGAWWSSSTAGIIGGLAGSVLGCAGALIGVLAQKGRARGLALGTLKALMLVGALGAGLGVVAVVRSQPYAVVYPLLLVGSLCLVLPLALLPGVRRRYEDLELRRMQARDLVSRHPA